MNEMLKAVRGANVKSSVKRNSFCCTRSDLCSKFSSEDTTDLSDPCLGEQPNRSSFSSKKKSRRVRFRCDSDGEIKEKVKIISCIRSESIKKRLWWTEQDLLETRKRDVGLCAELIENEYYRNVLFLWDESTKRRTKIQHEVQLSKDEIATGEARGLERVLVMEIPKVRRKVLRSLLDAQKSLQHVDPESREKALSARYRNSSRRAKQFARHLAEADSQELGLPMIQANRTAIGFPQQKHCVIVSAKSA